MSFALFRSQLHEGIEPQHDVVDRQHRGLLRDDFIPSPTKQSYVCDKHKDEHLQRIKPYIDKARQESTERVQELALRRIECQQKGAIFVNHMHSSNSLFLNAHASNFTKVRIRTFRLFLVPLRRFLLMCKQLARLPHLKGCVTQKASNDLAHQNQHPHYLPSSVRSHQSVTYDLLRKGGYTADHRRCYTTVCQILEQNFSWRSLLMHKGNAKSIAKPELQQQTANQKQNPRQLAKLEIMTTASQRTGSPERPPLQAGLVLIRGLQHLCFDFCLLCAGGGCMIS